MEGQKIKPAKRHLGDKKGYYANEQGNYMTKTWHYETKQNVPTMK